MLDSATPWTAPLGSSVHRVLQARILEWVAIPFCRGSYVLVFFGPEACEILAP